MFNINDVTIKELTNDHINEVAALELLLEKDHGSTLDAEELDEMFNPHAENQFASYKGIVASIDGEIVGYCIWLCAELGDISASNLYRLAVREDWRREGIGLKLLNTMTSGEGSFIADVRETAYEKMAFLKAGKFVITRFEDAEYVEDEDEPIFPAYFTMRYTPDREPISLSQRLTWRAP